MDIFKELSEKRQSCRSFTDQPIEHEKLLNCLEAARLAPSACNSQPWSFVVAESKEAVASVAQAAQQLGSNSFVEKAQAFFVIVEEHAVLMPNIRKFLDSQYFAKSDLGAATAYLCLEAESQGLGTCQIGMFDREAIGKALGIPVEKQISALIAVGYPANETVRKKARKPLEELSRFV